MTPASAAATFKVCRTIDRTIAAKMVFAAGDVAKLPTLDTKVHKPEAKAEQIERKKTKNERGQA